MVAEKLSAITPRWTGQSTFHRVLEAHHASPRTLAHAGPPFQAEIPVPVRNSLLQAILFEGWATSEAEAQRLLDSGEIDIRPAQDLDCVVPLAGVISPSMGLHIVADPTTGKESYAAINEGMKHLLRVGVKDPNMVEHHRWLNGPFNDWLAAQVSDLGGIDLFEILAQSLQEGDDAHSRTMAGSARFAEILNTHTGPEDREYTDFLAASPAFALNLWMAACALVERSAEGLECDLITRVGGNGVDFGYKTARDSSTWVTFPATPPQGERASDDVETPLLGAIGDSAVVDFFGLGGQVLDSAPGTRQALGEYLPEDYRQAPELLGSYHHPKLGIRSGLSASSIRNSAADPIVLLGMIAADGAKGRVGGGVYRPATAHFN